MNIESFASLSKRELSSVQEDILNGKFGNPGDKFLTTRAFADLREISLVTAHNIMTELVQTGYICLRGKRYFLSHDKLLEEKNASSRCIALLVPKLSNDFYCSLSEAVSAAAKQRGYDVLTISVSYDHQEEARLMQVAQSLPVMGIINCIPTPKQNAYLYTQCALPCVMLGHALDGSKVSSVQVNNFPISQKIAQHLIEEGYKNFLYFGTKNLPLENDVRFIAFQMELRSQGYTLEPSNTMQLSNTPGDDDEAIHQLLKQQTEPTGIFCYHDLIAAKIYRICHNLGKKIPDDVGIVGFDDLSSIVRHLSLTSVRSRISTMAEMAVNLLFVASKAPNTAYDNHYIDPSLIIRKSSSLSSVKKEDTKNTNL